MFQLLDETTRVVWLSYTKIRCPCCDKVLLISMGVDGVAVIPVDEVKHERIQPK